MGTLLELYMELWYYQVGDKMARIARAKLQSNVFLIEQHSTKPVFTSNIDRNVFIDLLKQTQSQFLIDIYGYCLLDDYSFKLIINVHKQSISKIMQSLIISYTAHRKSQEPLFIQRFKSKPLHNFNELNDELRAIHKESKSIYNSFCVINNRIPHDLDWISELDEHMIEFKPQAQPISDQDLKELCLLFFDEHDCDMDTIQSNKELRNQCIMRLRQQSNCTLKQIGDLFGGLSESTISKIIKNLGQAS